MAKTVLIRFVGEKGSTYHYLKLGPVDVANPPERTFEGGDEVKVLILLNSVNPDCVDLTFADGEFAIEVPRDFFEIVGQINGR
jgi:hypothetical protein